MCSHVVPRWFRLEVCFNVPRPWPQNRMRIAQMKMKRLCWGMMQLFSMQTTVRQTTQSADAAAIFKTFA